MDVIIHPWPNFSQSLFVKSALWLYLVRGAYTGLLSPMIGVLINLKNGKRVIFSIK